LAVNSRKGKKPSGDDGANIERMKSRLFPLYYAPGKKLFQLVVRLSDDPGSFRSILDTLSPRVNLIGTMTYTLSDGTAMFSGFSRALSQKETAEALRTLILSSKSAKDAWVNEGREGLLLDTFHKGMEVGGEGYMLFRRRGQAQMFDSVVKMLGSGGEALLYEEGLTLGGDNAKVMANLLGAEKTERDWEYLSSFFAARGWAEVEMKRGTGDVFSKVKIGDCFECADGTSNRKGCNFFRGYLAGIGQVVFGTELRSIETRCRLKGADYCEFTLTKTSG
jgi:predicted hydrocarbon binding protein